MIKDNKSFCRIILHTLRKILQKSMRKKAILVKFKFVGQSLYLKKIIKISEMVNALEPFRYFILASEVKFDLGGQRSYFVKGPLVEEVKGDKRKCVEN